MVAGRGVRKWIHGGRDLNQLEKACDEILAYRAELRRMVLKAAETQEPVFYGIFMHETLGDLDVYLTARAGDDRHISTT